MSEVFCFVFQPGRVEDVDALWQIINRSCAPEANSSLFEYMVTDRTYNRVRTHYSDSPVVIVRLTGRGLVEHVGTNPTWPGFDRAQENWDRPPSSADHVIDFREPSVVCGPALERFKAVLRGPADTRYGIHPARSTRRVPQLALP